MTWYNPRTWFTAKQTDQEAAMSQQAFQAVDGASMVFISADPDHPHVGLSVFSETKLSGPSLCVDGITLGDARLDLCGKVIDWSRMTPQQAEAIKVGGEVTIPLSTFKSLFK